MATKEDTLDEVIAKLQSEMFALCKKVATESYESVWAQLDDGERIGKLAADVKLLRNASNVLTTRNAQKRKES